MSRPEWRAFAATHPHLTPCELLELAIREGRAEVVRDLAQHTDVDVNAPCDPHRPDSRSPLLTALHADDARLVRVVAALPRFDLAASLPAYESWSWARTCSVEVLRQYLAIPGSDVDQRDGNGRTLLHEVVDDTRATDKLDLLLAQPGIAIDARQEDGTTPLYRAGLAGNVAAFDALLARGADVDNRNVDNRWTILICAAAGNHVGIVERLLRRPALDVDAVDDAGETALHVAAERGHARIVELLLAHGDVRVNRKSARGWTPLAHAAFAGHAAVVRLLLARPDVEVDLVDEDRQSPLFHAASTGHEVVVRLLLADPRTNAAISSHPARQTAHDVATALGFATIAALLHARAGAADVLSPRDDYVERAGPAPPGADARIIRPPRR